MEYGGFWGATIGLSPLILFALFSLLAWVCLRNTPDSPFD